MGEIDFSCFKTHGLRGGAGGYAAVRRQKQDQDLLRGLQALLTKVKPRSSNPVRANMCGIGRVFQQSVLDQASAKPSFNMLSALAALAMRNRRRKSNPRLSLRSLLENVKAHLSSRRPCQPQACFKNGVRSLDLTKEESA